MKKIMKNVAALFMLSMIALPMVVSAQSSNVNDLLWGGQEEEVGSSLGLGEGSDPRVMAANIINIILGFLGIIAVVIILLGGFKWMTAAGNEDQVGEARKLMSAGVVGLLIILASWGIARFVINQLYSATQ